MRKMKGSKGFTLAELLIVVAVISVLVGVMFPVFGASLTKAQKGRCIANMRSYKGEILSHYMLGGYDNAIDFVHDNSVYACEQNTTPNHLYKVYLKENGEANILCSAHGYLVRQPLSAGNSEDIDTILKAAAKFSKNGDKGAMMLFSGTPQGEQMLACLDDLGTDLSNYPFFQYWKADGANASTGQFLVFDADISKMNIGDTYYAIIYDGRASGNKYAYRIGTVTQKTIDKEGYYYKYLHTETSKGFSATMEEAIEKLNNSDEAKKNGFSWKLEK